MQFPLFVKAVSGGGGRGMRRVTEAAGLPEAIEAASREAESAFGDPMVYLEQAVLNPRHIEVQILADTHGNVMHLFERDCSVQRRHQKVIELAPAPNLPEELRQTICDNAVAFAREINYSYAGTVEFLLDERGHHVFIEMNPRIQVEHTVTEEITDVDLVASQMRIADGETLEAARAARRTSWWCTARRCSAASPQKIRPTASGPTPAASPATALPAARASGWTAAPTSAPRSAPTSTRCSSNSPAAGATSPRRSPAPAARWPSSGSGACRRTSRSCRRSSATTISGPAGSPPRSSISGPTC